MAIESPRVPFRVSRDQLLRRNIDLQPYPEATAALLAVTSEDPSLILAPTDMTGVDIIRFVSAVTAWCDVPVVVGLVDADTSPDLAYRAMEHGAVALLAYPFTVDQLAAVGAHWGKRCTETTPAITVGAITVDHSAFTVTINGQPVHFTPREFLLLAYLVEQSPRVISVDELGARFSEPDGDHIGATRSLLAKIRRKLNAEQPGLIESVQGVGYRVTGSTGPAPEGPAH